MEPKEKEPLATDNDLAVEENASTGPDVLEKEGIEVDDPEDEEDEE